MLHICSLSKHHVPQTVFNYHKYFNSEILNPQIELCGDPNNIFEYWS